MRMAPTLAWPSEAPSTSRWPTTPVTVMPSTASMSMLPPAAVSSVPPDWYFFVTGSTTISSTQMPTWLESMPPRSVKASLAVTRPPMSIIERERSTRSEPTSSALMAPRTTMSPSVTMLICPSTSAAELACVTLTVPGLAEAAALTLPPL